MRTILAMILLHFVADYSLQGWLANAKQIKWWREQTHDPKYSNDWIAGLVCHSLYWSILTFLPLYCNEWFVAAVGVNAGIHIVVDHMKCNMLKINLVQDQLLHLAQIVVTYGLLEAL